MVDRQGVHPSPTEDHRARHQFERYVTFHLAEVAVSRQMHADILMLIARLHPQPAPA
jgi:hypothetical protein